METSRGSTGGRGVLSEASNIDNSALLLYCFRFPVNLVEGVSFQLHH